MIFVTNKIETLRRATAEARVAAAEETWRRMNANDLPKKDVLAVARCAGVLAAKKTPEIIPYCHPLAIDGVEIAYELENGTLRVLATVEAVGKTGVEMEALSAASVAALTVYDMLKPIDQALEITGVKLLSKEGGKTSFREKIPAGFRAAVIVSSDSTARGVRKDKSGWLILDRLAALGIESSYTVVPDDAAILRSTMLGLCEEGVSLLVTTGGTGLGPRDVTVEATREVIEREIPGIMEAARSFGQRRTPYAMLSRGLAGQRGGTLIVNLPGSSKGVEESLDAVFPAVLHAFKMMKGASHDLPKLERL